MFWRTKKMPTPSLSSLYVDIIFDPKADITAFEVACLIQNQLGAGHSIKMSRRAYDALGSLIRHFKTLHLEPID